jgi:hypothetical protein
MENQFISLQGLADKIAHQVHQLYDGQSRKDQLEDMVTNARDLYERLVVLRHKAYEQESITKMEETISNMDISFEIPSTEESVLAARQVSLIDIIEEIEINTDIEPELPVFELEVIEEEEEDVMESAQDEQPIYSLNDIIAQQQVTPNVVSQLGKSSVDDLKKAITMNQRFQFARELFGGDTEQYEITIGELNNCTAETVESKLSDLIKKRGWLVDSVAYLELRELIQRRHGV